ncbi:MAG: helix-turn-helix transcriptional regulator [Acidimicrobiia bacterium]
MSKDLIIEARRRAGLTQRELARRLGTHQPVIARWERGKTEPDFRSVVRVVRACGLDLNVSLSVWDDHDLTLIRRELNVLPHERLSRMVEAVNVLSAMEAAVHA